MGSGEQWLCVACTVWRRLARAWTTFSPFGAPPPPPLRERARAGRARAPAAHSPTMSSHCEHTLAGRWDGTHGGWARRPGSRANKQPTTPLDAIPALTAWPRLSPAARARAFPARAEPTPLPHPAWGAAPHGAHMGDCDIPGACPFRPRARRARPSRLRPDDLAQTARPRGHACPSGPRAAAAAPATASHRLQAASEGGTAARRRAAHPRSQTARRSLLYAERAAGGWVRGPTNHHHPPKPKPQRAHDRRCNHRSSPPPGKRERRARRVTVPSGVRRRSVTAAGALAPLAARSSHCTSREFGRLASGRPHHPQQISRS